MRKMIATLSLGLLLIPFGSTLADCPKNLDFTMRPLAQDNTVHLCEQYAGKVLVVVNTASKCGYTYQYDGLEALHKRYKNDGLVVLGFPSNDFGHQEPGSEENIQAFCRSTYGVKFPMFEKTIVSKGQAHPFFENLANVSGEYPRWNFHKYIMDRNGQVVATFPSRVDPQDPALINTIENLL